MREREYPRAALVHTDEALALVEGWGAPALLLPDDLPDPADAGPAEPSGRPTVMVAGSPLTAGSDVEQ